MPLPSGLEVTIVNGRIGDVDLSGCIGMILHATRGDEYVVEAFEGRGLAPVKLTLGAADMRVKTVMEMRADMGTVEQFRCNPESMKDFTMPHFATVLRYSEFDTLDERREHLERAAKVLRMHAEGQGFTEFAIDERLIIAVPEGGQLPPDREMMREIPGSGPRHLHVCFGCGIGKRGMKRCSGCHGAHFCSRECAKRAWPRHKETCHADGGVAGARGREPGAGEA